MPRAGGIVLEPGELPRRPGAADARESVEDVTTAVRRPLRPPQLPEADDVLPVRIGQRFPVEIGHDFRLVRAVLRQLAAGTHPAARIDVDALEGEGLARRLGTVERGAVVERHDRAATWLHTDRLDLVTHGQPLLRGEIAVARRAPRHGLR